MTSLAAPVNVYRLGNYYAHYEVLGHGVDTAEVWGSSPHAPTNRISNLQREAATEGRFYDVSYDIARRLNALIDSHV